MPKLIVNLPAIQCYVKGEYLHNLEKDFNNYYDCFWVTAKAVHGRAFLIESMVLDYGALYDKLPLSAYTWKKDVKDPLPLDYLQMWDCLSYDIEIIYKRFLRDRDCKVMLPNKKFMKGQYMFTIDPYGQFTEAETPNEHKSYNFIKLDNGQFCAYPNNRIQFLDKSYIPAEPERPKFKTCQQYYYAESDVTNFSQTDEYFYQSNEEAET